MKDLQKDIEKLKDYLPEMINVIERNEGII